MVGERGALNHSARSAGPGGVVWGWGRPADLAPSVEPLRIGAATALTNVAIASAAGAGGGASRRCIETAQARRPVAAAPSVGG